MEILDIGTSLGDYVAVGKVIKAHGIKGEVKVFPYSGRPDDFKLYKEAVLRDASSGPDEVLGKTYAISRSRSQEKVVIVELGGVSDRNGAEALRGYELLVHKEKLPRLGRQQYYWHELEGLLVKTDEGRVIGRITGLMATGAHDILIVTGKGREYMIPAENEFITAIDRQQGVMEITPPPGLLEMNG